MKIHIFALRWRDEIRRSSQLRTLLELVVVNSDRHGYLINMTADQPPSENGLAWGGVSGDRFLITVLVDQKIKIPA